MTHAVLSAQGRPYLLSNKEIYDLKQSDYPSFVKHYDEAISHYSDPHAADTLFIVYEQYLTGLIYYTKDEQKLNEVRSDFFELYKQEFASGAKSDAEYRFRYNFIACGVSIVNKNHKATEKHALQAISVFDEFPDSVLTPKLAIQYVKTYFMLCDSYVAIGKYEESLQANRYLQQWVTTYYGENHQFWNILFNQIDAAFEMERYAEAYDQYQVQYAKYLLEKDNRESERVGLLLRLSDICWRIHDDKGFTAYMNEVEPHLKNRKEKVYFQLNLGNQALKHDTSTALLHFHQAIEHDSMNLSPMALDIHHTLANIYADRRDMVKSKHHYYHIVNASKNQLLDNSTVASENPNELLISAYSALLQLSEWENDQPGAKHYAGQLMRSIKQIKNNDYFLDDKIRLFNKTYDYFGQLISYYSKRGQMDNIFSVFRQSKAQLLKESIIKRKNNRFGSYEEEAKLTDLKTKLIDKTLSEKERLRIECEMYKLREKMNFETSLALETSLDNLLSQDSISLEDFQAELDPKALVIEYYLGKELSYAMVIDHDSARLVDLPKDSIIQSIVLDYLQANSAKTDLEAAATAVKKMIWPSGIYIETYDFLSIIPDGIIHYFPFESLSHNHGLLIDHVSVSYQLYSDLALTSGRESDNDSRLFAVAPTFSTPKISDADDPESRAYLSELSYNLQEVQSILTTCDGVSLSDTAATKKNFLKQYQDYNMFHFSTHAVIGENSDLSYIAFSNQNDDDKLYQYEIETLNFDADMVVLSACETGVGAVLKGESMFSLKKAFMQGGCQSVISSLWAVNDQCTAEIMAYFYQHLQKGMRKDQALRQAKLDYIKVADPEYRHPYYWAGFTVVGDISPIHSVAGLNQNPILWLAGGCVFLLWSLYRRRYRRSA